MQDATPLSNPRLKSTTSSAVHMVDAICDFRETQAESHIFVDALRQTTFRARVA